MLLEFITISENDLGKRSATAGIVHDVLHDTLDVTEHIKNSVRHAIFSLIYYLPRLLDVVKSPERRRGDSLACVSLENSAATASLC